MGPVEPSFGTRMLKATSYEQLHRSVLRKHDGIVGGILEMERMDLP